jgi:Iap family predicted aminopeptidase
MNDPFVTMIISENKKLRELLQNLSDHNVGVEKENNFLRESNKDLRQKTWYNVYEENLKLVNEVKKYKHLLESIEKFIGEHSHAKR